MEIVLIRHGRTASNEARRYLGRADEPLSPDGRNQARALHLSGIPHAERVYSSPLKRCLETAEIVFPGCAPIAVPEFVEIDFGRFEGRTHDQLTAEEPAYTAWLDSRGEGEIPGGETQAQLRTRVRTGFLRVAAETDCLKRIAVVVHSGVIMAIISEFARPKRNFYDCFIGNCQTVICGWDGSFLTVKGGDLK